MEEKKWGTYKVSIDKIGRKWTQVTIHYPSGYTHAATIDRIVFMIFCGDEG